MIGYEYKYTSIYLYKYKYITYDLVIGLLVGFGC